MHSKSPLWNYADIAKLPHLEMHTFNGELIKWRIFLEQFKVVVRDNKAIANSEKLLYLRQALGQSSATRLIEGISHTGEQYDEVIDYWSSDTINSRVIRESYTRNKCLVCTNERHVQLDHLSWNNFLVCTNERHVQLDHLSWNNCLVCTNERHVQLDHLSWKQLLSVHKWATCTARPSLLETIA